MAGSLELRRRLTVGWSVWVLAGAGAAGAFVKWPYLQAVRESAVVVRWETAAPQGGLVQYGFTPEYGHEVTQSNPTIDHELTLTGLLSDTVYHYRVISDGDTSLNRTFRSMPGMETRCRFIVYGDPHGDSISNQRVVDRMVQASPGPGLLVCTGDLTADCRLNSYRSFFNTQRPLLAGAPLFPALGNRDIDSIAYWYRFLVLFNNERYYSVRYGGVAFHLLNVQESFLPGSEQYEWLVNELRQDSANPQVRHIFIAVHTPAYSTNQVYSGNSQIRQYLCPLFERYGVEAVFSGHVHAYEHSLVNGVHYLTTGGGGASLATGWNAAQPWTVYREASYHFLLVDVSADSVLVRGIRLNGTEFDSLVLVRGQVGSAEPAASLQPGMRPAARSPVVSRACLEFELKSRAWLRVQVFDASGRLVSEPACCWFDSGRHVLHWFMEGARSGVYYWRLNSIAVPFLLLGGKRR